MPANKPPSNVTLASATPAATAAPSAAGSVQWYGLLRRDDRSRVIPDLANVLIALREEPNCLPPWPSTR